MGGNVACAASRLGLHTGMVSWVGDDADSRLFLEDLRRFGVDTTQVNVVPNSHTSRAIILIDPTGEKAIILLPTSSDTLSLDPPLTAYLQNARLVYCTAYDPAQLARVAEVVHAAGGLISTDIEPMAGLQDETFIRILALVDILFIDAKSIAVDDYSQIAKQLQAAGPEMVILSFGARGSLACDAHGITRCPAFEVPVVDTTGAGDCFAAAFLAAYVRRLPRDQALCYANAAAALSIQGYGARGTLPSNQEVQILLADYKGPAPSESV